VLGCAFCDLFLEDLRSYREHNMARIGMAAIFPVWSSRPTEFVREFITPGFQARVVCLDPQVLDTPCAGRSIDEGFLRDPPPGIDPYGENGEFHTFVVDRPIFSRPVACTTGDVVIRSGFCFCDLLPV
jgi:diphthamide synthase (EF-2-diphthine--ammonia ligase)